MNVIFFEFYFETSLKVTMKPMSIYTKDVDISVLKVLILLDFVLNVLNSSFVP